MRIDDRGEKRVLHVAVRGLRRVDAVPAASRPGLPRGVPVRKLQPAKLAPNDCAYSFSTSAVSRSGSTVMETKDDLRAEVTPELILHERHHRCEDGAGCRAHGENEGHGDHLAAEVRECDRRAVLRGQRKFRRRRYLRQRRLERGVLRGVARKRQQKSKPPSRALQAPG